MKSNASSKLKELLMSRKFISSISAILAMTLGIELAPEFQAYLISGVGIVYILATGIQSGLDSYGNGEINLVDKLKELGRSRKAIGAVVLLIAAFGIELPEEATAIILALITGGYNLATALETGLRTRA